MISNFPAPAGITLPAAAVFITCARPLCCPPCPITVDVSPLVGGPVSIASRVVPVISAIGRGFALAAQLFCRSVSVIALVLMHCWAACAAAAKSMS